MRKIDHPVPGNDGGEGGTAPRLLGTTGLLVTGLIMSALLVAMVGLALAG